MTSFFAKSWMFLHFIPFLGSARYATEAAVAYFSDDDQKARDKGIIAVNNAIIDLSVLSLFLISITHIANECEKNENLKLVKPLLVLGAMFAVFAVLIGSKIVAEQISRAILEKVVNVNTASKAMVNSVTMTATGIEAVVEKVNVSTTKVVTGMNFAMGSVFSLVFLPFRLVEKVFEFLEVLWQSLMNMVLDIIKLCLGTVNNVVMTCIVSTRTICTIFVTILSVGVNFGGSNFSTRRRQIPKIAKETIRLFADSVKSVIVFHRK